MYVCSSNKLFLCRRSYLNVQPFSLITTYFSFLEDLAEVLCIGLCCQKFLVQIFTGSLCCVFEKGTMSACFSRLI